MTDYRVWTFHVTHLVARWLIFLGSVVDYMLWQGIKDQAVKGFKGSQR